MLTFSAGKNGQSKDFSQKKFDKEEESNYNINMKALMVGEFRRNFSKVLDIVKRGEEIIIRTGRKKENIAVLVPFEKYTGARQRKLGILENKASFTIRDDFKITDEELLNL